MKAKIIIALLIAMPTIRGMEKKGRTIRWKSLPTELKLAILSLVPEQGSYTDFPAVASVSKEFFALIYTPEFLFVYAKVVMEKNPEFARKVFLKVLNDKQAPAETKALIVEAFLDAGINANIEEVIELPKVEKEAEVEGEKTKNERKKSALIIAVKNSELPIAKLLLDHQANVNGATEQKKTPLMYATKKGNKEMVGLLLDAGAEINAKDANEKSALSYAAKKGNSELSQLLIERGAHVNDESIGLTPLMYAAQKGHEGTVRLLLDKGADPKATLLFGDTALSLAQQHGQEGVAKILRERTEES